MELDEEIKNKIDGYASIIVAALLDIERENRIYSNEKTSEVQGRIKILLKGRLD